MPKYYITLFACDRSRVYSNYIETKTRRHEMKITYLENANGSDVKWYDVDGEVLGLSEDGRILESEGGTWLGPEWEARNWEIVDNIKAA